MALNFAKALLTRGFFPAEVPPPFTGRMYGDALIPAINSLPREYTMLSHARDARLCRYNLARAGALVRHLSIPNPVPYVGLAVAIETAWPSIRAKYGRSRLSLSQPVRSGERAVKPRRAHGDLQRERNRQWRLARHVLRTDIAMCYESIYTHTIPWAAHGKSVAKTNRQARSPYWGNFLDRWVQKCQDGQTRGLPIGPDASLVIAEIVLSACDVELQTQRASFLAGFRHYDDYDFATVLMTRPMKFLDCSGRPFRSMSYH